MNNKGFTLVELLTAVTILVLLGFLATTTITNIVRNSKNDLYDAQIELIKATAETWGSENIAKLPDEGECNYITLDDLVIYGLFEGEVINPKTNKPFASNMKIKMTSTVTESGKLKTTYEADSKNVDNCKPVYPSICTLISGNEKEIGSKYECEVKPGTKYNFYVISKEENGTSNLIMERNICDDGTVATESRTCLVEWISAETYGCTSSNPNLSCAKTYKGPITAMNHVYNATKDWENVSNIKINHSDEKQTYGKIETTNNITRITKKDGTLVPVLNNKSGYENLKARLPFFNEVYGGEKCTSSSVSNLGSCPLWLVDYLKSSSYYDETSGKTNIETIDRYFTLDSVDSNYAKAVDCSGYIGSTIAEQKSGIRLVINARI